jgi:osmotically-inducible protein OsmY
VSAAFSADPQLDHSAIVIQSLGPVVILEGYIATLDQREIAVRIAETIVGSGKVRDRMLSRFSPSN